MTNDLDALVADGFSIGYTRQHSMIDEFTDFSTIVYERPGNLCLSHPKPW